MGGVGGERLCEGRRGSNAADKGVVWAVDIIAVLPVELCAEHRPNGCSRVVSERV